MVEELLVAMGVVVYGLGVIVVVYEEIVVDDFNILHTILPQLLLLL